MIRFHREKVVEMRLKNLKRKNKKVLTNGKTHDIISELRREIQHRTLTNKQQCNPENSKKELFREQNLNKVNERLNLARVNFDQRSKLKHESLILAQDERWRRA